MLVYGSGLILLALALYIQDYYFTERWEWPTFMVLPILLGHALVYSALPIILSCWKSRKLWSVAVQAAILYTIAFNFSTKLSWVTATFPGLSGAAVFLMWVVSAWIIGLVIVLGLVQIEKRVAGKQV
jgi:hypothetical protein